MGQFHSIVNLSEKPEFADVCAAWSFGEWGSQIAGRTLEQNMTRYRNSAGIKNELPCTWLALVNDRPAGMISLKDNDHPDHNDLSPWLASLYIHPEYRGKGLAAKLIAHVEDFAKTELKIPQLYLFTHTADALYKKRGWIEIKNIRDPSGIRPEGDTLFKKELLDV
ncbi:MAG: GNAT family N-acetyltransferase [Micavibrio aeruginosavorus]|uniref:GNAT family N-acetyltransferase n=1 Tax=Micavibrio aeruginosavorus TaxID=349221 RepID=A0A2W5FK48_9BACT|nr:MAG: GNAT family N-acetyltransferase [Micavibrio aeruginosavorus]